MASIASSACVGSSFGGKGSALLPAEESSYTGSSGEANGFIAVSLRCRGSLSAAAAAAASSARLRWRAR